MYQNYRKSFKMVLIVTIICLFAFSDIVYGQSNSTFHQQKSIEQLLNESGYDPTVYPGYPNGTTNVFIRLHFYDIHSISETDMDFTAELYFILRWKDERLRHLQDRKGVPNKTFYLTSRTIQKIWRPNVYFTNERSATLHTVPQRNEIMYICPNGTILYNMRLSVKHACQMELHLYPFDIQKCKVLIESYSYPDDIVHLFWESSGVQPPETHSRHFELFSKGRYSSQTDYTLAGNFSSLSFEFILTRQNGYYILSLFTPSGLIVILSWISFLIDPQIVHGRLSLGSVCFLSMISLDASTQKNLPSVSYMKAVDIWMICCQIFVFLSLIEFAIVYYRYVFSSKKDQHVTSPVVNYGSIPEERKRNLTKSQETSFTDNSESMSVSVRIDKSISQKVNENSEGDRNTNTVNVVDKWSRGMFPAAFVVFLIVYAVTFSIFVYKRMCELLDEEHGKWLPFNPSQSQTSPCFNNTV